MIMNIMDMVDMIMNIMDIGHDEHGGHDLRDRDGHNKILENVVIKFQNRK